jgi:hypothetical protein
MVAPAHLYLKRRCEFFPIKWRKTVWCYDDLFLFDSKHIFYFFRQVLVENSSLFYEYVIKKRMKPTDDFDDDKWQKVTFCYTYLLYIEYVTGTWTRPTQYPAEILDRDLLFWKFRTWPRYFWSKNGTIWLIEYTLVNGYKSETAVNYISRNQERNATKKPTYSLKHFFNYANFVVICGKILVIKIT